jgi:ABC-type transport system involved in cytochrome c biogenesis permease subunit
MEKLSLYLFASGLLTTLLALGALAMQELSSRLFARRSGLATLAGGGGTVNVRMDAPAGSVGRYARMLSWFSVVILLLAIITRASASGRGPFSNMYDFSIAFGWGILLVYVMIDWRYRMPALGLAVLPVSAALMLYAASLPSDIQPLVPALQNNSLLTLHVSVAIIAYSCFAVSAGAATLYLLQSRLNVGFLPRLHAADEVGFLSAALGFPFMTYWAWDPKETASLVTWLLYAGYLHTRALRAWRGQRSALLLLFGFIAVMLTYFGNYFLGGLHSYA